MNIQTQKSDSGTHSSPTPLPSKWNPDLILASLLLPTGISVKDLVVSDVKAPGTQAAKKGRESTTFQEHGGRIP